MREVRMRAMRRLSHGGLLLLVLLSVATSCGTRRQAVKTISLREVVSTKMDTIEVPADSTELRLVIECLPGDTPHLMQPQGATPSQLRLYWQLLGNELFIKALAPPHRIPTLTSTITKEVPVEVEVVREVNKLHWWQTTLMWCGGIALLLALFSVARRITKLLITNRIRLWQRRS